MKNPDTPSKPIFPVGELSMSKIKSSLVFFVLSVAMGLLPIAAQAASFDCAKAGTPVEKMICSDQELSDLDETLSNAYSKTVKIHPDPALKETQKAWLKERNQCKDVNCLKDKYNERIAKLNALLSEYGLIKGKGVEVCEAYLRNLSSFRGAIWVRRPINPELKDFSKPKWEKTIWEGAIDKSIPDPDELYQKINEFLFERDANPGYYLTEQDLLNWTGDKQQIKKAHEGFMDYRSRNYVAGNSLDRVDIDNDGKPELVYYDNNSGGQLLIVFTDDGTDIDYVKTKLVMQHKSRAEDHLGVFRPLHENEDPVRDYERIIHKRLVEDAMHDVSYGVFFYKNKTYFDSLGYKNPGFTSGFSWDETPLRIYLIENKQVQETCTYRDFF